MTRLIITFIALLTSTTLFADKITLIDHTDKWNLFSKFELGIAPVDEEDGAIGSLTIGGLLNDQFGIGLTASMLLGSVDLPGNTYEKIEHTDYLSGGVYLEYVFYPNNLIYFSLDLTAGAAQLELTRSLGSRSEKESVWMIEPGINVMINITETFMFGLGAAYRLTDDIDIFGIEEDALTGFVGSAFLRFTQF